MELGLTDHKVLVAGSSRGIGRAIADAFLSEGACVFITGRDKESLLKTQQELTKKYGEKRLLALVNDFRKDEDIERCKQILLDTWGHIDHLIINMGTGKSSQEIISDAEQWDFILDQNLNGPCKLARAFLPHMQQRKNGNIIFISSIAGKEAIKGAPLDYSVAKSALIAFSKNLSRKVAADGIRVNTIAPGNIFFPDGSWDEYLKSDQEKVHQMLENNVPMRRFGTVEEIAMPVLFLSSSKASFVTGAVLTVDGGQTCVALG